MSDSSKAKTSGTLPLPKARSPRDLDERILAHARRHAPERQATFTPRWIPGLATAGIVGLALLIAYPQLPTRTSDDRVDDLADDLAQAAHAPAATQLPEGLAHAKKRSAPTKEAAVQPSVALPDDTGTANRAPVAPANPAQHAPSEAPSSTDLAGVVERSRADSAWAARSAGLAAAAARKETDELPARDRDAEDKAPSRVLSAREVNQRLDAASALIAAGKIEQAIAHYALLRKACSDCGLPETLLEALHERERGSLRALH